MAGARSEIIAAIEELIGVAMSDGEIERTLIPLARSRAASLGLDEPGDYLRRLAGEPREGREWSRVIAAVTNGQTSFFRDPEQFVTLRLLIERLARERPGRRIAVWSSACSTGEEPYSIAMLCVELGVPAQIVGSDVDVASLERARAGYYRPWTLRKVSEARLARWFSAAGDGYRLIPAIREAVSFARHNLVRDPPLESERPDGSWDIALCRNALIYFRRERVAAICDGLVRALAPGGALLVAASESLAGLEVAARPEMLGHRVVYRPAAAAAPVEIRQSSRPRPAVAAITRALPERLPALLDRVARLAVDDRLAAARSALEAAGVAAEQRVEVLLTLGHLHLCGHDFEGALDSYARAAELDDLLFEVHYFTGLVHRKRRAWRAAVEALRRAVFLAPTSWQASFLLAGAYHRLGRDREAARERARTRELLSGPPPIVAFVSHPLFVERFGPRADEARRMAAGWRR